MTRTRRAPRPLRRAAALAAAVLALGAPLAVRGAAPAHGTLKSSEPARGAHLTAVPRALRLTFTERPEDAFTRVRLLGPDSVEVALGPLTADTTNTVTTEIRGVLAAGVYTVAWQIAGADGHPVRGTFSFTIAPGASGLGTPPGLAPPPSDTSPAAHHDPASIPTRPSGFDAESAPYAVVRWLQFTALLVVVGALAFEYLVLGRLRRDGRVAPAVAALARQRAAALGLAGAVALAATAVLRLVAQSYAMHGPEDALATAPVVTMLGQTVWGWGWLLQVVGVAVAITGFLAARRGRATGWALAAAGGLALAVTPALSGHAAATPGLAPLAIAADAAHVVGAGGWLGSLLFVLAVGIPAAVRAGGDARGAAVAHLVNAFSPTALFFAALVAVTGACAAWLHLGAPAALWETAYGRTLLVKLAVLSAVVATGGYNWRRVRPALGDDTGTQRIRRSAAAELAVGALVLAVTAVLVATPPG